MTYTVIGYYDDSGTTFADTVEAANADEAFAMIAAAASGPLVLVACIEGDPAQVFAPCDDSGKTCFASDYPAAE